MIKAHVYSKVTPAHQDKPGMTSHWFDKLDPRAKIVGVFAFVVATALLTRHELVVLALCISVAFALMSRVDLRSVGRTYFMALPFIAIASLSVFLFSGPWKGATMLARTSACVISLLVVVVGTESFDLFSGMRRLKVPWIVTTLLMLTQRYTTLLSEELARMNVARKARGFMGGRNILDRYGFRVLASTAGAVLLRAWLRADRVYEGLKVRGFQKEMKPRSSHRIHAAEASFMIVLDTASALLIMGQMGMIL